MRIKVKCALGQIFIVLVDANSMNDSWKLKRNIDLLKPSIVSYLNEFKNRNTKDLELSFSFKGKLNTFNVLTDIIFVIK